MKFRVFEFEDQPWLPGIIRDGMTDYLRFLFITFNLYDPVIPLLKDAVQKTRSTQLIDLCSGGGGAMEEIYNQLRQTYRADIQVVLTDLFPNIRQVANLKSRHTGGLIRLVTPVDATDVPADLKGFRTLFSSIHHFDKQKAKQVVKNAVGSGQGIGIFDGGDKNIWMIMGILIFHPVMFLLCTPFIRPFRFSRIFFTYLVPVIPLCTVWDGVISILRLYTPDELLRIGQGCGNNNLYWMAGKVRNRFGMKIAYLIGYPKDKSGDLYNIKN